MTIFDELKFELFMQGPLLWAFQARVHVMDSDKSLEIHRHVGIDGALLNTKHGVFWTPLFCRA